MFCSLSTETFVSVVSTETPNELIPFRYVFIDGYEFSFFNRYVTA